jgi:hypothetical protein
MHMMLQHYKVTNLIKSLGSIAVMFQLHLGRPDQSIVGLMLD